MSFEYVTVEQNGNVLLVTLNRPEDFVKLTGFAPKSR